MVDRLVKPEHQYRDAVDPPLDPIRMAWPFKDEHERKKFKRWVANKPMEKALI